MTGDLLFNGGAWRYRPGTSWGIQTLALPAGANIDRVAFNSAIYAWAATWPQSASAITTIAYQGDPPGRAYTTALTAGIPAEFFHKTSLGTPYAPRATIRALHYSAAIGAEHLFDVPLPLPRWHIPCTQPVARCPG